MGAERNGEPLGQVCGQVGGTERAGRPPLFMSEPKSGELLGLVCVGGQHGAVGRATLYH